VLMRSLQRQVRAARQKLTCKQYLFLVRWEGGGGGLHDSFDKLVSLIILLSERLAYQSLEATCNPLASNQNIN
jgi:hypothetical protein